MHEHAKIAAVATGATWMSWFTWVAGHLFYIDQWLQFAVLCLGLATGVYALRAARKAFNK